MKTSMIEPLVGSLGIVAIQAFDWCTIIKSLKLDEIRYIVDLYNKGYLHE